VGRKDKAASGVEQNCEISMANRKGDGEGGKRCYITKGPEGVKKIAWTCSHSKPGRVEKVSKRNGDSHLEPVEEVIGWNPRFAPRPVDLRVTVFYRELACSGPF